ncbi:MAG: hypothetical protein E6Z25_00510 [Negativicoccus succinicivorans]|uniref:hypothetical protein n=1 Tax=Negativicoccus succinicivorans TaxID=620903 RepID=UPI00290E3926|nr:hypothetical protein [Negativicoccus succinicivorans]MDU5914538.1 hypothetical protein [Negativicoccus succinicivorans]
MEKMEMLRQLTDQIDMEQVQDLYRRFKAGEINQSGYEAQVRSFVETVGAKVTGAPLTEEQAQEMTQMVLTSGAQLGAALGNNETLNRVKDFLP